MGKTGVWVGWSALSVLTFTALVGCTEEKIVFRDRELFEPPVAAAASFLGYTDHNTKLTVCGNCHVEKQGDWEGTAHANAWDGLQSDARADASCEGCHSVGPLGNVITEVGGHAATSEARYEDVQCEACHGPGLNHVQNPKDETVPLAPFNVEVGGTSGCGECHSGAEQPFLEEWALSRHGDGAHRPQYRTREGCNSCHGGKGFLETWGVNTNYLELADATAEIGVTCAVCHDPHSGDNEHQLRFPLNSRDVNTQLCMRCHQRRATPDAERASSGPHSPQGPLLLGEIGTVGWTPPNFAYDVDRIAGTHGSEANPELCATCHMNSYEVTDPTSGDHVFSVTGHTFDAIPCLDARGIPSGDEVCAFAERTFSSCTASGCHGSQDAARSAYLIATARIENLTTLLSDLLALVPATEFDNNDGVFTVAEGADFNAGLGGITSSAIHNPFLTEALLTASIQIVMDTYGVQTSSDLNLEDILMKSGAQQD